MKRKPEIENKPKAKRGNPAWQKGAESPNPGGRPKVVEEFKLRARRVVDEHVLEMWEKEVSKKGKDWVKCSELLVAYGYGRPTQSLEAAVDVYAVVKPENPDDTAPMLTREERRAELRMHLQREGTPLPPVLKQLPESVSTSGQPVEPEKQP